MGTLIRSALVILFSAVLLKIVKTLREYHKDTIFGRENGCQLPPKLTMRWPLGIDRLFEVWRANSEGRLLAYFNAVAKEYEPGNNLYQYLLFGPGQFHVLHPRNLEAVLSTKFDDFGFGCRPDIFAPLLGNGIFTQEGAAWKHSRELLRKQFSRMQYQKLNCFDEHVENLISCLPTTGGVVDLQPLFFDLSLDVATATLFGRSVYSLRCGGGDRAVENREFAHAFDTAQEGLPQRLRLLPFHFLYNPPSFRKACRKVHEFVERYIRDAGIMTGESGEEQDAGTDDPQWFMRQVAQGSSSQRDLRDQLLNVLLAGRDTTACCMSWVFRLLVRHPDVMIRLRSEITDIMQNCTIPSRDQIKKMKFLSCVIRETLRLYPSVPLNFRQANVTTILPTGGGPDGQSPMLVRKGELVVFSSYTNSRLKSVFGPDAEKFRPERWETGELGDPGWKYYPFIGGPRRCLGEDFALMEISYTIVRLLQAFPVIELPEGEPNEPIGTERHKLTLVLSCADGCRVYVKPRKN
ncbi:cytochrome P450 52A13 [Naviculisporaceae sp. PSN 640]